MTIQEIEKVYITEQQRFWFAVDSLPLTPQKRAKADFIKEVIEAFGELFFLPAAKEKAEETAATI